LLRNSGWGREGSVKRNAAMGVGGGGELVGKLWLWLCVRWWWVVVLPFHESSKPGGGWGVGGGLLISNYAEGVAGALWAELIDIEQRLKSTR
jgi:hypothetical protein